MTITKRHCVVPDLDDELTAALSTLDELFTALRNGRVYDAEALEPGEEPDVVWPAPFDDESARDALERMAKVLRLTQGTEQPLPHWWAGSGHRPGMGERRDGRYEHVPLRFVYLDQADLDTLAAAGQVLGLAAQSRPSWLCDFLSDVSEGLQSTPTDLVSTLARVHGLLDLAWTDDVELLHRAFMAAHGSDVLLDGPLEAAYERTANRLNDMWALGNQLQRWLY